MPKSQSTEEEGTEKHVTCKQCGYTLKSKRSLDQHVHFYHKGDKKESFKCKTCNEY
jgi:hypothetical protein